MLGDVVSGVAVKVIERLLDPIQREISYAIQYQKNVQDLKNELENLGLARQRLERKINQAKSQATRIHEDVQNWCIKVENFHEQVIIPINEDQVQAEKPCFGGLCPNFFKRYMLSRKAAKAGKDCTKLLEGGRKLPSDVSYDPDPVNMTLMPDSEYEDFGSRKQVFQHIMNALNDCNMIGVCGMSGVGKSTLVKEVARQAVIKKLFHKVAIAEVKRDTKWEEVQKKVAYDLGVKVDNLGSLYARSDKLCQWLMNVEERVLIILDDIWEKPRLRDIGIPFENDNQRRCTLLLSSINQQFLCSDMNAGKVFEVEMLSDEDAESLFWKIVNDHSRKTASDFTHLARGIIKKCGGLPIAITTVAKALKNNSRHIWNDVHHWLYSCNPRKIEGLGEKLSPIEVSYTILEEEAKLMFRLCGLQNGSSQIPIDVLMKYGMGLGLIADVYTLEAARNRVHRLINDLKAQGLLFGGDNEDHVKMNEIIHALAVSIAADQHMFNIQNVSDMEEKLGKKECQDPTAISIPFRVVDKLPQTLNCSNLKLFLLLTENPYLQIPDNFFHDTTKLQVLELSGFCFTSLPSSFDCLTNLRTLSLECCQLKDVTTVGTLKTLQILSFRGSDIEKLPGEIGKLTCLKLLDLSNCSKLEEIMAGVISPLSRLEELYMSNSFAKWEVEGQSNVSLVELKPLLKLTTLDIHVRDLRVIPQNLDLKEFDRYTILIGHDQWSWSSKYETSRTLKLKLNKGNIPLKDAVKKLVQRTEDLYLDELSGFKNVVPQLDEEECLTQLKQLHVQNSSELLYIVNSEGRATFSLLESLFLHNLIKLEKIFHRQVKLSEDEQAFSNLRIINVEKCHSLKHLFSLSVAKNLSQLQEIDVTDCNNLKMIVGKESSEDHSHQSGSTSGIINFTKLQSLTLRYLPLLKTSVFDLEIAGTTTTLFNEKVTVPHLEKLILSSIKIEKIWLNQYSAVSYGQTLTILTVEECDGLKFLFSSSVVTNIFVGLQRLEISKCKSMKELIHTTELGRNEEKKIEVVFPKLVYLSLSNLPELTKFGIGNSIELPFLRELEIDCCPNLKSFISTLAEENIQNDEHAFFNEKVEIPRVEVLRICSMNTLRKIWHHSHVPDSFSKLKHLEIEDCNKLLKIFPSNMQTKLQHLQHLTVIECKSLKEIIEDESDPKVLFDKLIWLKLRELPKLKNFEPGRGSYAVDRTLKKQK